jgi:predicted component of type VI protein secretion system
VSGAPDATRLAAGALLRAERVAGPHLRLVGEAGGGRFAIGDGLTVGRGRRADLRVEDAAASRLHVRVTADGDGFVATDLGSRNGLRVNGRACRSPRRLRYGDVLVVGTTRLSLEPGELAELAAPCPPPCAPSTAARTALPGPLRRAWQIAAAALLAAAGALLALG